MTRRPRGSDAPGLRPAECYVSKCPRSLQPGGSRPVTPGIRMLAQLEVEGHSTLASGHMDTWNGQGAAPRAVDGSHSDARGRTKESSPPVALTGQVTLGASGGETA